MNTTDEIAARLSMDTNPLPRPQKPNTSEYGYQGKYDVFYSCSREELITKVRSVNFLTPTAKLVWTPEVETLVETHEIPYLFAPFKRRICKVAILKIIGSAITLAACAFLTQRFPYGLLFLPLMFVVIPSLLFLWEGAQTLVRLKHLKPETVSQPVINEPKPADIARIIHVQTIRLTWTKEIMACLITVGVLQLFAADGIHDAGLVKPAVWHGEVWRLLTAGLLHGGLFHFWMNFGSLMWLGRMTEAFTHRAYLPIVFLLAVVSGCLCSLWLNPTTTSVGASGGLMGLIGFLVVVGWRHKSAVPANFFQNLLLNLALIAIVGFIGRNFIDNAGHLGGLLAGLALGFGLISAKAPARQFEPTENVRKLSQFFRALVLVTAAATCLLMYRDNLLLGAMLLLLVGTASFSAVRKLSFFDRY